MEETDTSDDDSDATSWDIVFDKSYVRIGDAVRSIIPQKKIAEQSLCPFKIKKNAKISSDSIIAENWFGRFEVLWGQLFTIYPWSEDKYENLFVLFPSQVFNLLNTR